MLQSHFYTLCIELERAYSYTVCRCLVIIHIVINIIVIHHDHVSGIPSLVIHIAVTTLPNFKVQS